MKKVFVSFSAASLLLLAACNNSKKTEAILPAPGTVIDSISEDVKEDKLNDDISKVVVTADTGIKGGIYDVHAEFGKNIADGKFTMPKGLTAYTVKVKKTDTPYMYMVGFLLPDDTTFHPYLQVKADKVAIGMKYVKSYTFE